MKDAKEYTAGTKISRIQSNDPNETYEKLSDIDEDWSIPTTCPKCKKIIHINKRNANKRFNCACGQKILVEIEEGLL